MVMKSSKLLIAMAFIFLASCSVYESGQRKAIETNEGGIVGAYGFAQSLTEYYICEQQTSQPDFLKSPLEVIDTPFDSKNITTLYNSKSNPPSVVVYTVASTENSNAVASASSATNTSSIANTTSSDLYTFCRVSSLLPSTRNLSAEKIQQIARFATQQIEKLLSQSRP